MTSEVCKNCNQLSNRINHNPGSRWNGFCSDCQTGGQLAERRQRLSEYQRLRNSKEWKHALDYFGNRCAVCGQEANKNYSISADHWLPLSKGNKGTFDNIIPLCCSITKGSKGCNNRKGNRDPLKWLTGELGKEEALKKIEAIETYFRSL